MFHQDDALKDTCLGWLQRNRVVKHVDGTTCINAGKFILRFPFGLMLAKIKSTSWRLQYLDKICYIGRVKNEVCTHGGQ